MDLFFCFTGEKKGRKEPKSEYLIGFNKNVLCWREERFVGFGQGAELQALTVIADKSEQLVLCLCLCTHEACV